MRHGPAWPEPKIGGHARRPDFDDGCTVHLLPVAEPAQRALELRGGDRALALQLSEALDRLALRPGSRRRGRWRRLRRAHLANRHHHQHAEARQQKRKIPARFSPRTKESAELSPTVMVGRAAGRGGGPTTIP